MSRYTVAFAPEKHVLTNDHGLVVIRWPFALIIPIIIIITISSSPPSLWSSLWYSLQSTAWQRRTVVGTTACTTASLLAASTSLSTLTGENINVQITSNLRQNSLILVKWLLLTFFQLEGVRLQTRLPTTRRSTATGKKTKTFRNQWQNSINADWPQVQPVWEVQTCLEDLGEEERPMLSRPSYSSAR